MPRRKISEYRAKNIVNDLFGLPYVGFSILDGKAPTKLSGKRFVVKVDQAVKQRFKRGLIFLDVSAHEVAKSIKELNKKGYDSILVEPYVTHDGKGERYISLRREREGVVISYSQQGGVEIESHADSIKTGYFESFDIGFLASETGLSIEQLTLLREAFDELYMSLLEINPYVVDEKGKLSILDAAIEVDSSAELLVNEWTESDMRSPAKLTEEELVVRKLNNESPASFSLEVINPDGGIFLLLSGGGASVVIADEIFTHGYGDKLANYGEYSGNPSEHEAELYANQVFALLAKSKAKQKVALIGGAVANFTDIASTFKGIISALQANQEKLISQDVRFYVRRGGPRQKQGLKLIRAELERLGLLGGVYDPSVTIPEAVESLVSGVKK